MVPIAIDRGDQLPQGHTSLNGNVLEAVPELVFKTDAGLVSCNDNRTFGNRRFHGFSPANEPCGTLVLSSSILANEANSLNLLP
jgi:hypothetical protein